MLGPFLLRFFPYRALFHRVKAFLLRSDVKSRGVCITITHANYNIPVTINHEMKTSSLFALIRPPYCLRKQLNTAEGYADMVHNTSFNNYKMDIKHKMINSYIMLHVLLEIAMFVN